MNENYIYDDFLESVPAERFVTIKGEGIENGLLDIGFSAVIKIYEMAEKNEIPYAESIELSYCANCDVTFKGANLLLFLREYYPKEIPRFSDKINPDSDYTLLCIDFS